MDGPTGLQRSVPFGHGGQCGVRFVYIAMPQSRIAEQASGFEMGGMLGQQERRAFKLGQSGPEDVPLLQIPDRLVDRSLSRTNSGQRQQGAGEVEAVQDTAEGTALHPEQG